MADAKTLSTDLRQAFTEEKQFSPLFAVSAGIPADDALNEASCLLEAALGLDFPVNPGRDNRQASAVAFAVHHLISAAKALLDAANLAQIQSSGEASHV